MSNSTGDVTRFRLQCAANWYKLQDIPQQVEIHVSCYLCESSFVLIYLNITIYDGEGIAETL